MKNRCNFTSGPYDRCLKCEYLGNGCDGPRTTAMTLDRWCQWCRQIKEERGYTNAYISEQTGLSEVTVERIMACKITQDIMRSTAAILENFLIGSDGKWPCAMDANQDKEVVYMDKPETLTMLTERGIQVENLRRHLDDLKGTMDREVERVRQEYEDDVSFYKEQILTYKEQISFLKDQVARKDSYIDRLLDK